MRVRDLWDVVLKVVWGEVPISSLSPRKQARER